MNNINEQQDIEKQLSKQVWRAPVLETCNIEQTMTTTGSAGDGGGETP